MHFAAAPVERVQVFAFVEIPQHRVAVFSAGRAKGAVRGDGDGVEVAAMAVVIRLEFAIGQIPNLGKLDEIFLNYFIFFTLTTLSQPLDTMIGFD